VRASGNEVMLHQPMQAVNLNVNPGPGDVTADIQTRSNEALIKEETKATIRCIPLGGDPTPGVCMVTGKPSKQRVLFARAY